MQPPEKENVVNLGTIRDFYLSQAVITALTTSSEAAAASAWQQ